MIERKAVVKSETGLHARPAMAVVKLAGTFKSKIVLVKEGREYDAKNMVGIMMMASVKGDELLVRAEGTDEETAVEAVARLIESDL